jgi:transcription elongation factor GreB
MSSVMSKAFTKETDADEELDPPEEDAQAGLPPGTKNYMTPEGADRLRAEWTQLAKVERPKVVEVVSWAAGNGDRSENGDYIYGKRRLREIDRRIRFLSKRLEIAEIVDPSRQQHLEQVFFGRTVTLVGIDETDSAAGRISWVSPLARGLMKARVGDKVEVRAPTGVDRVEILDLWYGAA